MITKIYNLDCYFQCTISQILFFNKFLWDFPGINKKNSRAFLGVSRDSRASKIFQVFQDFQDPPVRTLRIVLDVNAVTWFQRIHHVGRVAADRDIPRLVIAWIQKYPDVVEILKKRRNLDRNDGYGIGPDLPKKL